MDGIEVYDGPDEEEPGLSPDGYYGGEPARHKHRLMSDDSELQGLAKPDYADCGGENPAIQDFLNKRLVIESISRQASLDSESDVANTCVICFIDQRSTVFVPCGHLACCAECSDILMRKGANCPICRSKLQRVIKNVILA